MIEINRKEFSFFLDLCWAVPLIVLFFRRMSERTGERWIWFLLSLICALVYLGMLIRMTWLLAHSKKPSKQD